MYAFSKFDNGKAAGSLELYNQFEKKVKALWSEFDNKEKAQIFFGFINRGVLNLVFYESHFKPWILENMKEFDHDALSSVAFGLIVLKETDKQLWRVFV